jgi:hypothetical protein
VAEITPSSQRIEDWQDAATDVGSTMTVIDLLRGTRATALLRTAASFDMLVRIEQSDPSASDLRADMLRLSTRTGQLSLLTLEGLWDSSVRN